MSDQIEAVVTEQRVTPGDIHNLLAGEGGVDLRAVVENGRQIGMRIVGVMPGTTAARLGAQNDDLIESINDMPLSSVAEAYRVGGLVSTQSRLVIRGRRRGTPYTSVLVLGH